MNNWKDLFRMKTIREDLIRPHLKEDCAKLFSAIDRESSEIETLEFLYTLVRLIKPKSILETGTWKGYGTLAMASALRKNNLGTIISIEKDAHIAYKTKEYIKSIGYSNIVSIIVDSSINYIQSFDLKNKPTLKFDLVYLDSTRPDRPKEFKELYKRGLLNNLICFHDTSLNFIEDKKEKNGRQIEYLKQLNLIKKKYPISEIEFFLSRGLRLWQIKK